MGSEELGEKRAKELGLHPTNPMRWPGQANINQDVYRVSDVHRILGSAVEVFGRHRDGADNGWTERKQLPTETEHWSVRDHKGYLIGITPIKVESAGDKALKLLQEMVNFGMVSKSESFYERAKELLRGDK